MKGGNKNKNANEASTSTNSVTTVRRRQSNDSIGSTTSRKEGCGKIIERWYILLLFSLLSLFQSAIWSTYSPITDVVQHVYGWNDANIAILNNWDPITFICTAWIFGLLLDKYGLRFGVVLSTGLVLASAILRCVYIPHNDMANTLIQNGVEILDAAGGPILWGIPTVISALWFPASQRTLVTSVVIVTGTLGSAIPYLLEPAVIHNRFRENLTDNETAHLKEEVRAELYNFYYITGGVVAFLSLCVVLHFPSRPKHAPSLTASQPREPFCVGVRQLGRSGSFWCLFTSYSLTQGISASWISVIFIVLQPLHTHDEKHAGLLGFLTYLVQSLLSLAFGKAADLYIRHSKFILISSLLCSAIFFGVFALMATHMIAMNVMVIDVCVVMATSIVAAVMPNYMELTNEVSYPVSEALCSMALTVGNEIVSIFFYLGISAATVWLGTAESPMAVVWMYWSPLASVILGILPLVFVRPQYRRMEIDSAASAVNVNSDDTDDDQAPLLNDDSSTVGSSDRSAHSSGYGSTSAVVVNVEVDDDADALDERRPLPPPPYSANVEASSLQSP